MSGPSPRDADTDSGRDSPTTAEVMAFWPEMRRTELEVKEKQLIAEQMAALQLELAKVRLAAEKEKEQMALEKEKLCRAHEAELECLKSRLVMASLPTFCAGNDDADTFLANFEQACLDHSIPEGDYMKTLRPRLSDILADVAAALGPGDRNNYSLFKKNVRAALGRTPEYYRKKFRDMSLEPHETCTLFFYRSRRALDMWLEAAGAKTVEDLLDLFLMEQVMLCLPEEIRQAVLVKKPKTSKEAAVMAEQIRQDLEFRRNNRAGSVGSRRNWNRQRNWNCRPR